MQALFGAALVGLHPLAAETVNYTLARGEVFATIGVAAGLCALASLAAAAAGRFPAECPQSPGRPDWEMFKINMQPKVSTAYRRIRNVPFPVYLVPVVVALLANPAAAAFGPILLAYILIFEPELGWRRALPSIIVCATLWVFQTFYTFRFAGWPRVPAASFWFTQPWAVVRYFVSYLAPFRLTAVSNLHPFHAPWAPLALAGVAGTAALVWLAVLASRRPAWKDVSFGLWWFLIAAGIQALVPRSPMEAYSRVWLAYAGLAFAVTRAIWHFAGAYLRAPKSETPLTPMNFAVPALLAVVLAGLGWLTWQRNEVWQSDESIWSDVLAKNPGDGVALMNYGLALIDAPGVDFFFERHRKGLESLQAAAKALPGDPAVETKLAILSEQMGLEAETEGHYLRAIAAGSYQPAYAHYADWLREHKQPAKAVEYAMKARAMDPDDLLAARVLIDVYLAEYRWEEADSVAQAVLRIDSEDPDATRARDVAGAGMKAMADAESLAKSYPSVDNYLSLSALCFHDGKYEEAIRAAREALRLRPDLAEAWVNIAAAYQAMNRPGDTIEALRAALKLNPNLVMVRTNLNYELAHQQAP